MFFPDPADYLRCPNCHSRSLQPDRSYWDWECADCGCRFPSLRKLDRQIDRWATAKFIAFLFLLLFVFSSTQLLILPPSGDFMHRVLIYTLCAAVVCLLLWLLCNARLTRLERQRRDLSHRCREHC